MISENSSILDNKYPGNVEILRGKYELEGELKRVCEEKDIAVAYIKNLNRQYENAQATLLDMESDQIKLQSRIDDITIELVVSCESANEIKTNCTTTIIVKFHLDHMYKD